MNKKNKDNLEETTDVNDEPYSRLSSKENSGLQIDTWREFYLSTQSSLINGTNHNQNFNDLEKKYSGSLLGQNPVIEGFRMRGNGYPNEWPPLQAMAHCIKLGIYPEPELLITIANQMNTYLKCEGKVGAEEIFFGAPKKRAGTYSKQAASRASLEQVYLDFSLMLCKGYDCPDGKITTVRHLQELKIDSVNRYLKTTENIKFESPKYRLVKHFSRRYIDPRAFVKAFERFEESGGRIANYRAYMDK